jgi:HEAT repeat protein
MTVPDDTSLPRLLTQLSDPQASLAHLPLESLSDLDDPGIDRFQTCWQELPVPRRLDLLRRLGQMADDSVRIAFDRINVLALRDPEAELRQIAIRNLWESDDPALVPLLLDLLKNDPSPAVRAAAAAALGHFVYLGEVEQIDRRTVREVEDALLLTSDSTDEVSLRSLESLGYSSRPEVVTLIHKAYAQGSLSLRQSAILAMGRSCDGRWAAKVMAHLNDPAPELRLEAARAAGDLELHDATADIIELLDDVHLPARHAAIWTLGQLGGKEALRALSRQFDETEDEEEAGLLQDAIDNVAFVDGMGDFSSLESDDPAADEI